MTIPAMTTPDVPQTPCRAAEPCWVPGAGFRRIEDTSASCWMVDRPLEGKAQRFDPYEHVPGTTILTSAALPGLQVLRLSIEPCTTACVQVETPHPFKPVPLPSAGWLMLVPIALLLAKPAWQAAGRFGAWFTAERGTGPGQNGWVGGPTNES